MKIGERIKETIAPTREIVYSRGSFAAVCKRLTSDSVHCIEKKTALAATAANGCRGAEKLFQKTTGKRMSCSSFSKNTKRDYSRLKFAGKLAFTGFSLHTGNPIALNLSKAL